MRGNWVWLCGLSLLACSPNATGAGSSTANTLGEGSGDPAPTTGTTSPDSNSGTGVGDATGGSGLGSDTAPASTGPGSLDTSDSTSGDSGSTGPMGTGDDPLLTISDGPEYDFGDVMLGADGVGSLTVSNIGGAEATGITGLALSAPFGYAGGAYPGTAGDCGDTLDAGQTCTVELSFSPATLGPFSDTLAIAYDGAPDATRPVTGGGAGQSDNLLLNPGGETQGTPPPNWTVVGSGNWVAGDPWDNQPPPFVGAAYLGAYDGPNNDPYRLRQDVDVSPWSGAIDQGTLRFAFQGRARSFQNNNDDYRMTVQYRDGGGGVLETFNTNWLTSNSWQLYADDRLAPIGTREIRVTLYCQKPNGNYCDAFFDELDLRAVYP